MSATRHVLPQADARRKTAPLCRGVLDYFPAAIFAVAEHSYVSDRKHNPETPEGSDPHWARDKSTDHVDCILRHLAERGTNPAYHLRAVAWRALAVLQEYCEAKEGAAPGLASVFPPAPEVGEAPACTVAMPPLGYEGPPFREAKDDRLSEKQVVPSDKPCLCGKLQFVSLSDEGTKQLRRALMHEIHCPAYAGGYAPCTCRGRR